MKMRPWQSVAAIVATLAAAGAVAPLEPTIRITCVMVAFGLILVVLVSRLTGHAKERVRTSLTVDKEKIDRIREARSNRYGDR